MTSLQMLLEANLTRGLLDDEFGQAVSLIKNGLLSDKDCWVCKISYPQNVDKVLVDINLCRGHAHYALVTRK